MPDVQPLLVERRPDRARELERREDRVERGLSALVAAGALACIVVASPSAPDLRWLAVAIVAAAAAASVRLYVGGGSATAAVLGVVPMLWVLPLAWVPAAVVASQCLAALPGAITGRHRPWRVLSAVGDAGYVFGPVLFLLALTDGAPPVLLMPAALAVQFALDATLSVLREWLGRGIRPELQLDAMLTVFAVDALLLPIAVVIALQAELRPEVLLALVPFCVLLAAIARERNARVCEAADRVSALEVERDRIDIAMHRTSRSLAAPLDGLDALEVAVGTTVDALGAAAGRARFAGSHDATVFESLPARPAPPSRAPCSRRSAVRWPATTRPAARRKAGSRSPSRCGARTRARARPRSRSAARSTRSATASGACSATSSRRRAPRSNAATCSGASRPRSGSTRCWGSRTGTACATS